MTSLQTTVKQIPANLGYYTPVADCRTTFYQQTGTDAAPNFSFQLMLSTMSTAGRAVSSYVASAGAGVLRDHGKTLLSSSRVFRKVQIMVQGTSSIVNGGTDGVAGASYEANTAAPYLTGYIELPGTGGYSSGTPSYTPVARLG